MLNGAMAKSALDALNRAAQRAQRRAELEVAKMLVERHLGYEIGETQFGWLADRAACDEAMKPKVKPNGAASSRSTATTVQYPDAEAVANAKRGYEAHLASEVSKTAAERPRPVARPQLVRVNSVPVLAPPVTPAHRIRRTGSGVPHAPSQADGDVGMLDGDAPAAEPTEKRPRDNTTSSRRKKRAKKTTKVQNQEDNGEGENQDWENWGDGWSWDGKEAWWNGEWESDEGTAQAPPATERATTVTEEAQPPSTTPGQGQQLAIACVAHGTESSLANPPGPKTAAKSKAEPTARSGKGKGVSKTPDTAVKVEQDIGNNTQLAAEDNLRRANTSMQHTPGNTDLEDMIDREVKKEPQENGSSPAPASTAAMPNPPRQAPPQQAAVQPVTPAQASHVAQATPAQEMSQNGGSGLDSVDMRLFLVWDSESISETTDTIVEDLFSCVDGSSDSEEPRHKRRPITSKFNLQLIVQASKKKKKGKAGKKKGKGKKKETPEQKEKRLEKERKKLDKEKERKDQKAVKDLMSKGDVVP
eukprot:s184_g7.t1